MGALKNNYARWKSNPSREREIRKTKEKLSTREIGDLMGIHRPCYERRHGALRQKII